MYHTPAAKFHPPFSKVKYLEAPLTGEDIAQAEIIVAVG
jgi:hypothetical protein